MPGTGYSTPAVHPYGQIPYGYAQMEGPMVMGEEIAPAALGYGVQGLPVGTGGDCGCGGPASAAIPPEFVPPTPPIYSAPYTGVNVAQPPFMNPYGIGPGASPYGMPRYVDESNEQNG
jgi:morphogenetic protein associated with SpoVID